MKRCSIRIGQLVILALISITTVQGALFEYPRDSNYIVIEYTQLQDIIIDADPIPMLRIYGDGRVLVHYPVYMKRAGDYQMRLTDADLQQLLNALEQKGILSFDTTKVLQLKKQSANTLLTSNKLPISRSDDVRSKFKIKLSSYQSTTSGLLQTDFKKTIDWKNLKLDTLTYPNITTLKNAVSAEQQLTQYLSHTDLIKIK